MEMEITYSVQAEATKQSASVVQ